MLLILRLIYLTWALNSLKMTLIFALVLYFFLISLIIFALYYDKKCFYSFEKINNFNNLGICGGYVFYCAF